MKVVIFAGGLGTRLSEETSLKPKPMVEIGGMPILWHIMKIYSHYGFNEFIICLGYKGYKIKEWFSNYHLHRNDVSFDLRTNTIRYHKNNTEDWKITLVDTGQNSMTGGRLKRVKEYIGKETFMATYGDGVGNININSLIDLHKKNSKTVTLTSAIPKGRFGALKLSGNLVTSFKEKMDNDAWINAGFFVMEPSVFDYIEGDHTVLEKEVLEKLAANNELCAYKHHGFWQPMDKLYDKIQLEELWKSGKAEWKVWGGGDRMEIKDYKITRLQDYKIH